LENICEAGPSKHRQVRHLPVNGCDMSLLTELGNILDGISTNISPLTGLVLQVKSKSSLDANEMAK
jgi:hypothetical protein